MSAPNHLAPPSSPHLSRWAHMSTKERAKAAYLALDAGWDVDLPAASAYDSDSNTVVVSGPGTGGTATWGVCSRTAEHYLARIGERFGDKALARVREVLATEAAPGVPVAW